MSMKGRPKGETLRTLKMRELWLKAMEKEVIIDCETPAAALLIRFQLYNAVKPVRSAPETNPDLAAALEVVQISLQGPQKTILRIGRSLAAEKLEGVLTALGISGDGGRVKDAVDLAAEESLRKLQENLATAGDASFSTQSPRQTPYYTRDQS